MAMDFGATRYEVHSGDIRICTYAKCHTEAALVGILSAADGMLAATIVSVLRIGDPPDELVYCKTHWLMGLIAEYFEKEEP